MVRPRKSFSALVGVVFFSLLAFCGSLLMQHSLAAVNQIYISGGGSVQVGSNITVSVRITPPASAVDGVEAYVSYDASKLEFVGIGGAVSPLSVDLGSGQSTGSVQFVRAVPSSNPAGTTSDSLVGTITFKALAGSGSTNLSFTAGTNASRSGSYVNPSTAGTTISFTSPPATCPAGQTGTPPNCTTPPPSGGGGGSGSTTTTPKTNTGSTSNNSGSTSNPTTTTPPATSSPGAPTVTVGSSNVSFNNASFKLTSSVPVKALIAYGTTDQLGTNTPESALSTSPELSLDPKLLTPGTKYFYRVEAVDEKGNKFVGDTQTFKTEGFTVKVTVIGESNHLLAHKKVTLHSDPMTATTDDHGVATFQDVAPGSHEVQYTDGKTYKKSIVVAGDILTGADGKQVAAEQNFSVVFDEARPTGFPVLASVLGTLLILAAVLGVLFFKRVGPFGKIRNRKFMLGANISSGAVLHEPPTYNADAPTTIEPTKTEPKND